jgi:hypothetical protein
MTKHKLVWSLATLFVLVCSPAWASHKAWVLYHGGGDCAFQSPRIHPVYAGDGGDIVLRNKHNFNRTAVCPIAAAGRWGSSGTENFGVQRWAEAKRAYVRVYNGHLTEPLTCQAVARLRVSIAPGGSLYYGTARSVTGQGNHTIELVRPAPPDDFWTQWGGDLETNEGARLRSLDFQCTLPAQAPGSLYSYIRGYGVAVCQKLEDCGEGNPTRVELMDGEVSIQGNGASCSSSSRDAVRGAEGLLPSLNQSATVSCPILPASQDSHEHSGSFKHLQLHYTGTGSAGCENNGTCPRCVLRWERDDGVSRGESSVLVWQPGGYVELLTSGVIPNWSTAGLQCLVPKGQRIRGYTAWATQTRVSGGR